MLFSYFHFLKCFKILKCHNNHSKSDCQIGQMFDAFHIIFSGILNDFLFRFFTLGEAWLLMFVVSIERAWLWKSLLLIDEKGNSVMQYGQFHDKGLFLRFLHWVSPMPMHNNQIVRWSNIWFMSQNIFRNSYDFWFIFFTLGEAWLLMFVGIRLWWSLLLIEEKGNSVMKYGQYHGKGLFLRFLYWVSLMSMLTVCILFSHKSHKTAGSMSLTSFIHILQGRSEKDIFFCWFRPILLI